MSYTPDRVFVSRLKQLDNKLGIRFEQSHGHFVITYARATGEPVPIYLVQASDGGFRQPDQRDMNALHEGDTQRVDMDTRLKKTAQYMADVRLKQRILARQNIRDMTRDDKLQLSQKFARLTGGKHNSTFRRITPKSKGLTAAEILNAQGN